MATTITNEMVEYVKGRVDAILAKRDPIVMKTHNGAIYRGVGINRPVLITPAGATKAVKWPTLADAFKAKFDVELTPMHPVKSERNGNVYNALNDDAPIVEIAKKAGLILTTGKMGRALWKADDYASISSGVASGRSLDDL